MQPNDMTNQPVSPVMKTRNAEAPASAAGNIVSKTNGPAFGNGSSVVEGKGGKKTGWILGLVVLAIIAAGGVGFGVWAWMDGNTQKDALNEQISDLKKQNNELLNQITELQNSIEEYENSEDGEVVLVEWDTAKAEIVDGVFSIKSEDGEIIAQDNSVEVTEIISCDSGTSAAPSPLICNVTTVDGQGKFVYSYDDGTLSFTATTE